MGENGRERHPRRWRSGPAARRSLLILIPLALLLAAGALVAEDGRGPAKSVAEPCCDPAIERVKGPGAWDPERQVMSFGNNTWSTGRCCAPFARAAEADADDPTPQSVDFDQMGLMGLEYTRVSVFPCLDVDGPYATDAAPWKQIYDRFVGEAAKRRVQVLPFLMQGLDCTEPVDTDANPYPDQGRLSKHNPPDHLEEYRDLGDAARKLAEWYAPWDEVAGLPRNRQPGQFWRRMWAEHGCTAGAPSCTYPAAGGEPETIYYVPIRAWQIWNEPNIRASWGVPPGDDPPADERTTDINPVAYRKALFHAREGLRAVDPSARVITAGLSGVTEDVTDDEDPKATKKKLSARQFIDAMLEDPTPQTEDAGDRYSCAFDGLAAHFYSLDGTPEGFVQHLKSNVRAPLADALQRTQAVRPGEAEAQLWITELGAPSAPSTKPSGLPPLPGEDGTARKPRRSEARQREWVKLALEELTPERRSRWKLGPTLHFNWLDWYNDIAGESFSSAGLWAAGGVPPRGQPQPDATKRSALKAVGAHARDVGLEAEPIALPPVRCPGYTGT